MKYLVEHKRWQPSNLKKYDNSGILSHLQLLLMVDYNEELIVQGMKLPIVPRDKRQPIAVTDAERLAEFSQDIQSGHLKRGEIEETKLSSKHQETRDHRQSAEGGQPTPRSHSSSSDRWRSRVQSGHFYPRRTLVHHTRGDGVTWNWLGAAARYR